MSMVPYQNSASAARSFAIFPLAYFDRWCVHASSGISIPAQKAATKRKRAENPEATSRASKKWKDHNPDKVKKAHADKVVKVSIR